MTKNANMDFNKSMQDMMSAFPFDGSAMQNALKNQAAIAEKMSKVALEAAEKSNEIGAKWTKDALSKLSAASTAKSEVTDYSKAASDFASASAEIAAENIAAFAEVAKKVQLDTVELLLSAGKDISAEATAAATKATANVVKK